MQEKLQISRRRGIYDYTSPNNHIQLYGAYPGFVNPRYDPGDLERMPSRIHSEEVFDLAGLETSLAFEGLYAWTSARETSGNEPRDSIFSWPPNFVADAQYRAGSSDYPFPRTAVDDQKFVTLMRAEGFETLPRNLATRIQVGGLTPWDAKRHPSAALKNMCKVSSEINDRQTIVNNE